MRREPGQGLESDYGTTPDEGPLLRSNMFFVEIRREVEGEEDGPGDGERPDIGMQVGGQRAKQLRLLDLRVIDQGRHDGGCRARRRTGSAEWGSKLQWCCSCPWARKVEDDTRPNLPTMAKS